jgi:hypothetical protein
MLDVLLNGCGVRKTTGDISIILSSEVGLAKEQW